MAGYFHVYSQDADCSILSSALRCGPTLFAVDYTRTGLTREKVQVTVEAVTSTRRDAVAMVDPLPGFEPVNSALVTAERAAVAADPGWSNHQMLRDNRAEAFAMELRAGTHRFTYTGAEPACSGGFRRGGP